MEGIGRFVVGGLVFLLLASCTSDSSSEVADLESRVEQHEAEVVTPSTEMSTITPGVTEVRILRAESLIPACTSGEDALADGAVVVATINRDFLPLHVMVGPEDFIDVVALFDIPVGTPLTTDMWVDSSLRAGCTEEPGE
jgi:hypothetical protein